MYNVFLSGGGLKGAYQYGFFKELYVHWPEFPIKRVYAVSVGAINSGPIVTRKIDALDKFWCNSKGVHPFDAIVDDWYEPKTRSRMWSFIKHGSLFKKMKHEPYEVFLNNVNEDEWKLIKEKLFIVTFCRKSKTTRIVPCTSAKQIIDSIAASARFPGLFDAPQSEAEIDGFFANVDGLFDKHDEKWLCLDVQNDPSLNKKRKQSQHKLDSNMIVYSPFISKIPCINQAASVLSNRFVLDQLISNGKSDAQHFVSAHKLL